MKYLIPANGLNFGRLTNYKFPNQTDQKGLPIYNQQNHGYTEIPYQENICLNGHFQSERYFEGYRNEIREILEFPEPTINECAIHVRRGDYLHQQNRFPVLDINYYLQSVFSMRLRGIINFIVFSDDIEWCKQVFNGNDVQFIQTADEVADLKYMSSFKYMIIANSSYSLFASLINEKELVIAPKLWFGKDINLETKDLLPERFIKI